MENDQRAVNGISKKEFLLGITGLYDRANPHHNASC